MKVPVARYWGLPAVNGVRVSGPAPEVVEPPADPAAWNLPATLNVMQDGTLGLRQYVANDPTSDWTISVSGLPIGVTYDEGTESLLGASVGTDSATATFTLSKSGETPVTAQRTVALVDQVMHDITGFPLDANGWTDLNAIVSTAAYSDSQVVYVSDTDGNDTTAASMAIASVGADPFNPTETITPYATIETAKAALRDGFADLLLFKSGESWTDQRIATLGKSGAGYNARIIVSTYGGAAQASFALGAGDNGINLGRNDHVIVTNLRFESLVTGLRPGKGFDILGTTLNVLLEGCTFINHDTNRIQGSNTVADGDLSEQIALRRCVIDDLQPQDGDNLIYVTRTDGFLAEECVFNTPVAEERWLYMSGADNNLLPKESNSLKNVLVRGCIGFTSTTGAISARGGGTFDNNLFLFPDGMGMGGSGGSPEGSGSGSAGSIKSVTFTNNVMFGVGHGHTVNTLSWNNIDGGLIKNNIWAHGEGIAGSSHAMMATVHTDPTTETWLGNIWRNTVIEDNIVYNWSGDGTNRCFQLNSYHIEIENITIRNNDFQFPRGDTMSSIIFHRDWDGSGGDRFNGFTYSGNRYFAASGTDVFSPGTNHAGWITESGETGSSWGAVSYPDPSRDMSSYMTSIGNPGTVEDFMAQVVQQTRQNWNPSYTAPAVNNYIRAGFGKPQI